MLPYVKEKFGKIVAVLLLKWVRSDAKKGNAQEITEVWVHFGLSPKKAWPTSKFKWCELIKFLIFNSFCFLWLLTKEG